MLTQPSLIRCTDHSASRQLVSFAASATLPADLACFSGSGSAGMVRTSRFLFLFAPCRLFLLALFPEFWFACFACSDAPSSFQSLLLHAFCACDAHHLTRRCSERLPVVC